MRQIHPHQLWIGHAGDGRSTRALLDAGICAIVQLALEEPAISVAHEFTYCRFPLLDGTGNNLTLITLAIQTVAELARDQIPTLVCCGGGMSRSPAIVAAALAILNHADLDDCLTIVTDCGSADVSPAFWQEVTLAMDAINKRASPS